MGFNISLSGINAANADLNVTANNIANVNTTGFKESRAEFADLFSATSYGLSKNAVGSGVRLTNVAQQFSQGNNEQTGRSLDMAISGEGFFTMSMNGARVYSRAGNFQTDQAGYVTNPQGARLQVFAPNADGTSFDAGRLVDLQLLTTDSPPKQTSKVNVSFTLPADAKVPTVNVFDPTDSNSYSQSTGGITVYDSLGVSHTQTSYFVKTANPNEWQVYNYVDGQAAGGATTLTFNNAGALTAPANGQITLAPFTPSTGAGQLALTLDISGSTQYGEKFQLRDTRQDGYAAGKLNEISISADGVVFARYSNGADAPLGHEIRGIDLSEAIDDATIGEIDRAWGEHGVVVFRDQDLTPAQLVSVSRRFGGLLRFGIDAYNLPSHPEIFVVSNIVENGRPVGMADAGRDWHTDMCFTPEPPRGSLFHAVEVPVRDGVPLGDTCFAATGAAWEALPAAVRARIDGRMAVFSFANRVAIAAREKALAGRPEGDEDDPLLQAHLRTERDKALAKHPDLEHPLVRRHPVTG
ncbi:MAG: flagellar hook-basal body complex protein, partial [Hydrogenophaga sp.]